MAWVRLDDVKSHFGVRQSRINGCNSNLHIVFLSSIFQQFSGLPPEADPAGYSFLCPDGHLQPLDTRKPCVWLAKPWPSVAAQRYCYFPFK